MLLDSSIFLNSDKSEVQWKIGRICASHLCPGHRGAQTLEPQHITSITFLKATSFPWKYINHKLMYSTFLIILVHSPLKHHLLTVTQQGTDSNNFCPHSTTVPCQYWGVRKMWPTLSSPYSNMVCEISP
jgi:hypothetical protein